MKNILSIALTSAFMALLNFTSTAQCNVGEVEVVIIAYSYDVWAEESYWELAPAGNGCGNGTYISGGAAEVGCSGNAPTGENGIPDYGFEVLAACVPDGQWLDLIFVDWYGDGGLAFDVFQDGQFSGNYWGGGLGNVWSFQAGNITLPAIDSPCGAVAVPTDGSTVNFNTSGCVAAFSEIEVPGLGCGLYGMWCEGDATNTAWAYFVAEENTNYRISTCNQATDFDTQLAVWHGTDCGDMWSFELISANDDSQEGCANGNPWASTCYADCLIPGDVYFIMVDGYFGQTGNVGVSVTEVDIEPVMQTQVNDMYCPLPEGQAPNASIYVSIYGSGVNFECDWSGPNGFSSTDRLIFNLQPGIYNLTCTTSCGEVFNEQYEITIADPWDVEISYTDAGCPLSGTGSISVIPGGGTPGYSINYFGPNGYTNSGDNVSDLNAGNHTVVVTDSRGCAYQQIIEIGSSNDFELELGADTTFCLGENVVIFAPAGLDYLWGDGSTDQFYEIVSEDWGAGTSALILNAETEEGCYDSDVIIVTIEECVGIEESLDLPWNIYPNPTSGLINLNIEGMIPGMIVNLFDQTGRIVLTKRLLSANEELSLSDLPSGIYMLQIPGSDFGVKRIVKL